MLWCIYVHGSVRLCACTFWLIPKSSVASPWNFRKREKESWEALARLSGAPQPVRIRQQSQRKPLWSLMKLLWGPGRAQPSPNHWFRVSPVFILLMLKVSRESRVIWPQICDYGLMLYDGLWSWHEGAVREIERKLDYGLMSYLKLWSQNKRVKKVKEWGTPDLRLWTNVIT